ncbi:hypothetical protein ES703_101935 [subsurface metagenome]
MESLSGKPFLMMIQTGKNWVSDNIPLLLRGIPMWWSINLAIGNTEGGWKILEVGNVYPY